MKTTMDNMSILAFFLILCSKRDIPKLFITSIWECFMAKMLVDLSTLCLESRLSENQLDWRIFMFFKNFLVSWGIILK